jgi:hypothetical protein
VGAVDGTDVRVAAVTSAHHARVYFCGGDSSYTTFTKWLVATRDDGGAVTFAGSATTWRLSGAILGTSLAGSIDRGDGSLSSFAAAPAASGTLAGLYETMAPCGRVGVIVDQASPAATPIVQGACINADPSVPVVQVNPLMPLSLDANGALAVVPAGASDTAFVHAAAPPVD